TRKDDVPTAVARERFGEHLFVALKDTVTDGYAELAFEIRDCIWRDVVGPVVDVQARTAVESAASQAGQAEEEMTAVHRWLPRSRSESRMRAPKNATMRTEIALIVGFAPRLAVA